MKLPILVTVKLGGSSSMLRAPRGSKAPTPSEHSIWGRMGMECGDEVTALGPAERGGAGPGAVVKPSLTVTDFDPDNTVLTILRCFL